MGCSLVGCPLTLDLLFMTFRRKKRLQKRKANTRRTRIRRKARRIGGRRGSPLGARNRRLQMSWKPSWGAGLLAAATLEVETMRSSRLPEAVGFPGKRGTASD